MNLHTNLNVHIQHTNQTSLFNFFFCSFILFFNPFKNCTFNILWHCTTVYNISDGLLSLQNYYLFRNNHEKKITYHKNHQRKNLYFEEHAHIKIIFIWRRHIYIHTHHVKILIFLMLEWNDENSLYILFIGTLKEWTVLLLLLPLIIQV